MTDSFSERLQLVANRKKIEQADLARALNKSPAMINRWWNGKQAPGPKNLRELCEYFHCSFDWLKTGEGEPFPAHQKPEPPPQTKESRFADLVHVPILGKVPAGFPQTVEEHIESYVTLPGVPSNCFALRVIGESMEPGIKHGDYVLFVIDREALPGDIVVVNDEFGDSMLKRLKEKGGEYYLVSDNPVYPTVQPNGDYRIMGVVIGGWRELKIR